MQRNKKRLFCEINPTCYAISVKKEIIKRHIRNFTCKDKIAGDKLVEKLPNLVSAESNNMIKRGPGIDPELQYNKAINIGIAGGKINGTVIHPGETFSFWETVGKITRKKGYKDGRVIKKNRLISGLGGGLCNLSNTLHLLILHSPLDVTEFHMHSDALAPDEGKRVPFSAGTSVSYNNIDYRFKNNTDQDVQLLVWCEGDRMFAELRSEREFPYTYRLVEEDHCFRRYGEKYYRDSKIFREICDRQTGEVVEKQLILDNHSEVMFDYSLIPEDQIAQETVV